MLRIDIAVEHSPFEIDSERLCEAVRRVCDDRGKTRGSISLAIVDDATIHDVNRRFLGHDETTDVVSFVLEESDTQLDGEIVACADVALRTAAELGVPPDDELLLYVIHGALHLTGHDDLSPEPRRAMRSAEQHYLSTFNVRLPAPADDT